MFEVATGLLGWRPRCFWRSTYWEYSHALVGHMKYHGKGKWGENSIKHWGTKEHEKAKQELAEANKTAIPATEAPADWRVEMKARRAKARAKRLGK